MQVNSVADAGRPTVLVVDDDMALGSLITDYLREERFTAIQSPDTMAALELLDSGLKIDVLLVDIAMPKGIPHGVSLALMAKQRIAGLGLVFMTGYPDLLKEAGELPGRVFVKPFDFAELSKEVRRLTAE